MRVVISNMKSGKSGAFSLATIKGFCLITNKLGEIKV